MITEKWSIAPLSFVSLLALTGLIACTPETRSFGGSGGAGGEAGAGGGNAGGGGGSAGAGGGSAGGGGGSAGAGGGIVCAPDTADCDMNGSCETNLLGDVDHCGACDTPCMGAPGTVSECLAGKCVGACGPMAADCDQDPATACQDLSSDSANCGACGHSCLGGACNQGACMPVLFDTLGMGVLSFALDKTGIYWGTSNGALGKMGLDGTMPTMIGNANGAVVDMAVTINGIYTVNGSRMAIYDFAGGQKWGSTNDPGVQHLAVDAATVVWTATPVDRVRRAAAMGSNQGTLSTSELGPTSIVLEGGMAYWINEQSGEIRRADPQLGNFATTIFPSGPNSSHLASANGALYWASDTKIVRADLGGAGMAMPMPIYPTDPDVGGLVTDGVEVYWTVGGAGQVWRGDVMGMAAPMMIADGQSNPGKVELSPDSVYWLNRATGQIARLAR